VPVEVATERVRVARTLPKYVTPQPMRRQHVRAAELIRHALLAARGQAGDGLDAAHADVAKWSVHGSRAEGVT